jgi:hypothetical protein
MNLSSLFVRVGMFAILRADKGSVKKYFRKHFSLFGKHFSTFSHQFVKLIYVVRILWICGWNESLPGGFGNGGGELSKRDSPFLFTVLPFAPEVYQK